MSKIKILIIILILSMILLTIIAVNFIGNNCKQNIFINNDPTYVVKYSATMLYNLDGKLNYRIVAKQIDHCLKQDVSWITQPTLIIYNANKIPVWLIKSDYAKITKNHMLYLYGHVKVNTMIDDSQLCKITANNARINLITQDIIFQNLVNLYGVKFNSSGSEMRGNLCKKNAILIGNVKTLYEVQNN